MEKKNKSSAIEASMIVRRTYIIFNTPIVETRGIKKIEVFTYKTGCMEFKFRDLQEIKFNKISIIIIT